MSIRTGPLDIDIECKQTNRFSDLILNRLVQKANCNRSTKELRTILENFWDPDKLIELARVWWPRYRTFAKANGMGVDDFIEGLPELEGRVIDFPEFQF